MRRFLCVPTINVLSKNKKKIVIFTENYHFYSHEILLYITLACYHNVEKHKLYALFFVLLGLMLYVHGKQLRACRDGQLSYPHCSWASLSQAGYQYLADIISPLTEKCSS